MFSLTDTMNFLLSFFRIISVHFVVAMFQPWYIGIILLIYILYKRTAYFEQYILGDNRTKLLEIVFESVMYGILAGLIISLFVNFLGIHIQIDYYSFLYLWIAVILLSLLHVRYLCFSYAAGLLALSHLLFGWPDIDVSGLLAVVALLHLAEAILIWSNGHKHAIPVFVRHRDRVVGAFTMQKYWPIPMALLIVSIILKTEMPANVTNINQPGWWPLMKLPDILETQRMFFAIAAIPAALGYSEIAITDLPKNKTRNSGILLAIYSVVLLILSVWSSSIHYVKYIAALFAPLAHEGLIVYWAKRERLGDAYFSVPSQGVRVLEVIEEGPAQQMGIVPGDVILRINNKQVMTYQGISAILNDYPAFIWVDVLRANKDALTFEHKSYPNGIDDLKILFVPRDESVSNVLDFSETGGLLQRLMRKRL